MVVKVRLDTVVRPWGSFYILETGDGYQVKQLRVKPESRNSLQYHEHRDEVWVVVQGHGRAWHTNGFGDIMQETIGVGDTIKVYAGFPHRIENHSPIQDLVLIEVQLGDPIDEEDIVRVADDYGRTL